MGKKWAADTRRKTTRRIGKFAFGILSVVALLSPVAHGQNLLPLTWRMRFDRGAVAGLGAPGSDGGYDVNLLQSWERQGFAALDGPGTLSCDFFVPAARAHSAMTLVVHLLCRVDKVAINGATVHGPIPVPTWDASSRTRIRVPDGCVRPGANHLEIVVTGLSYTGGLSHNFCRLQPTAEGVRRRMSVAIEVRSENHIFVDRHPEVILHYRSAEAARLEVSVMTDDHQRVIQRSFSVPAGEGQRSLPCGALAGRPGFYECAAQIVSGGSEGAVEWFGVSPERIACPTEVGRGFGAYWEQALKELAAVDPKFRMQKVAAWCTAARDGYVVDMQSLGGIGIRAYYFVPRSGKPHAAILHVPGYGQRARAADFIGKNDDVADLAVFIRGQEADGPGRFDPPNGPGLWGYRIYDEREYAYRGVYMDCVRAVEFLRSRSEIDPHRIGVMGGSQGGGLTLATAGLCEKEIAACAYWDPWPCDLREHMQIRTMIHGELEGFRDYYRGAYSIDQFQHVLDLVDTLGFAPRITCPVLFCAGLFDDDCPPRVGFAAYNRIRTPKRFVVHPEASHVEGTHFEEDARNYFKKRFGF